MNKPIEINEDCKFFKDLQENQKMAMWNLITSKGAVRLWTRGIKPNRHWKISDVKWYFGMNGNKDVLLKKLELLYDVLNEKKGDK
jgi:hypothetical protein